MRGFLPRRGFEATTQVEPPARRGLMRFSLDRDVQQGNLEFVLDALPRVDLKMTLPRVDARGLFGGRPAFGSASPVSPA